jgi:RHS repeat-associated protein
VALVDARANRASFAFDKAGRQRRMVDPLSRILTYAFDNAGRQTLRLDAKLQRVSYVYDAADRLTGRRYSDGSRVTLGYDSTDRRTVLNDTTGRTTSSFDAAGRLSMVVSPAGKRLTYSYDGVGQRTLLRDPDGGRTTYTWDDAGRITKLINPWAERTSWSYDNASRRTVQYLANGIRASYSYDAADRLKRLANIKSDGTTISSFDYAVDAVGNRTRVAEVNGDRVTWSYDNTYQLRRERRSGANAYDITHTYDAVGNQTLKTDSGARTTYSYDNGNQLVNQLDNSGRTTFTFDPNGNQNAQLKPSTTRTTYVWDVENRMTKALMPAGLRNTFAYNGDGQRVQREDSSGLAKLIWDRENILTETDTGGTTQAQWTLEPRRFGNLISQRRTSVSSFHVFDGLGSTDRLTDSFGSTTDTYLYIAFGIMINVMGATNNPFRFVGRRGYYFDVDTSILALRARYYDPTISRFMSHDPLGLQGGDPNLFSYAFRNPITRLDPSGLVCFKDEDCCITGEVVLNTKDRFQGSFKAKDYAPWPFGGDVDTAGPFRVPNREHARGFAVQMYAPFEGKENCGVTQSLIIKSANEPLLNGLGVALGLKAGKPELNKPYYEPGLIEDDPFHFWKRWKPQYKDGKISFEDNIIWSDDAVGKVEFTTCFLSSLKAKMCKFEKCCVVWYREVDYSKDPPKDEVKKMDKESKCFEKKAEKE